ncbi:MAG: SpoIIE family protein phosphatase [Victivallaceae bacterium]
MSIKSKILLSLLLLTGIGFGIISIYCLISLEDLGRYAEVSADKLSAKAIDDSKASLLRLSHRNLATIAEGQALITDQRLRRLPGELEILELLFQKQYSQQQLLKPELLNNLSSSQPDEITSRCSFSLTQDCKGFYDNPNLLIAGSLLDYMKNLYVGSDTIESIFIAGADGSVVAYPWMNIPLNFDPRLREWFKKAVSSDKPEWSAPYFSAPTGNLLVTCASAVKDEKGKLLAVAAIDVNIEALVKTFPKTKFKDTVVTFILDKEGSIIGSREMSHKGNWKNAVVRQNLLNSPEHGMCEAAKKMIAGETGIISINSQRKQKFIAFAPIKSTGWSVGISVPEDEAVSAATDAAYEIRNELAMENNFMRNDLRGKMRGFMFIGVFFLVMIMIIGLWISEHITKPLRMLIKATRDIGYGDFSCRIPVKGKDEIAELAGNFNLMVHELKTYMKNLEHSIAAQEKVENELELGAKIQAAMLPAKFSSRYGRQDIDLGATMIPSRKVGGDFYDFSMLNDHVLYFSIGDISDKGIPAAIFMTQTKTLMMAKALENYCPREILKLVNDDLDRNNDNCMFANIFCGIADMRKQELVYCNAAYNRPLTAYGDEDFKLADKEPGNTPVGPFLPEEAHYEGHTMTLNGSLRLFLYSNAVVETENSKGEHFGTERLRVILNQHKRLGSEEIIGIIEDELNVFAAENSQPDDITMLMIKFNI